jgi:site-specific DNA-methyltransferase (adenine-specific)
MKPYYETENGKLYHGDCLEILHQFEPVDLVLTDPPYGIGESNEKNLSRGKIAAPTDYGHFDWDKNKVSDAHITTTIRAAKNVIIFGGNYYGGVLGNTSCYLVWDKDNGNNDFADCELAWTNFDSAVRKFKYRWNGMLQENAGKHKEKRYHPTQKPVGLFLQILLKYARPGNVVLDPFAGVGTTALACERMGKVGWILIEQVEKYCEIAAKRIEAETKQLKLFA